MDSNIFPVSTVVQRRVERREAEQELSRIKSSETQDIQEEADIFIEHGHQVPKSTSAKSSKTQDTQEESYSDESKNQVPKSEIRRFRDACGALVNHDVVQAVLIFLIFLNAILMGVATFDFVSEDEAINHAFELTDYVFLIIFTVELALQFIYHGMNLFLDGWLVFDFVIILLSWVFSDVQIIRAFRIFRAVRLVGRVKMMRELVNSVIGVLPKMFAIMCLLGLVSYIFAVMVTTLFRDTADITTYPYFVDLQESAFTLFQIMTLDSWADITLEVQEMYTWAWVPIMTYIILSGFIVFNLVIGVVCEAVASGHQEEEEESESGSMTIPLSEQVVLIKQKVAAMDRSVEQMQDMINNLLLISKGRASNSGKQSASSSPLHNNVESSAPDTNGLYIPLPDVSTDSFGINTTKKP